MTYRQTEYFGEYLHNLVTFPLYVGSSPSDVHEEARRNMWSISISQEQAEALTKEDFLTFIEEVLQYKTRQVQDSDTDHGMLFYVWFDEQACQLRGSLVSDFHLRPPFACSLQLVDTPEDIVDNFLSSKYHDGIPSSELQEVTPSEDVPERDRTDYILNIYCARPEKR